LAAILEQRIFNNYHNKQVRDYWIFPEIFGIFAFIAVVIKYSLLQDGGQKWGVPETEWSKSRSLSLLPSVNCCGTGRLKASSHRIRRRAAPCGTGSSDAWRRAVPYRAGSGVNEP